MTLNVNSKANLKIIGDVLNAHPHTNISPCGVIGNNLCCGVNPKTIPVEVNLQYISIRLQPLKVNVCGHQNLGWSIQTAQL